jgi:hypothetical protein
VPMKYPNLLYTTLLSASLLAPFALRLGLTEPYPAVLMPNWAGTVKATGDEIDTNITAIYGRMTGRDAWIRLAPSRFLHPIPVEYFPVLAARYFGLIPSAKQVLKLGSITIDPKNNTSEEEVKSAKEWFRRRLAESGCDDNVLRITQEVVTIRRSDGAQIPVRYQDEKVIDLR